MPQKQTQSPRDTSAVLVGKKPELTNELSQHFSVAVTAQQLGVTEKGLRGILARRELESVKVGRLRRISRDALSRYLAKHTTPEVG